MTARRLSAVMWTTVLVACGSDVSLDADGAFITGNMTLNEECVAPVNAPQLQYGEYDISDAADGNPDDHAEWCRTPYFLRLLIETDVDETVVFDQAKVLLETLNDEQLAIDNGSLPNPFKVALAGSVRATGSNANRGVIEVEAIPVVYADFLADFDGSAVQVAVQVIGHTMDGDRVQTQQFSYPVHICDGCLTMCLQTDITELGGNPEDITAGECTTKSLAGMDGRYCIDPGC